VTQFPDGFLWGAATSAYQIEGSSLADGAGESNWLRFSHTRGRTKNGETGDIACDHYRRTPEDVERMRWLGLNAYRFSIAWSRVLPEGRKQVNAKGLAFYDRLVDLLLAAGIEPCVTLFHWDLPAALDDLGGWLNPDSAGWFADYAQVVFRKLGDRVPRWVTLNEPWVVTDAGFLHGVHAPGHASPYEAPRASHNLLRAHVAAVQAYRAMGRREIGIVVNLEPKYAASDSEQDLAAARRADAYMNRQYLDALFFGRYPEEMSEIFGAAWPEHDPASLASLREPIDFLGINYYSRSVVAHDDDGGLLRTRNIRQPHAIHTELGWEVHPESLTRLLLWAKERYGGLPLYICENGAAFYDPPVAIDGRVDDPLRVDYYRRHLLAAHAAIQQGVDLRGYFAWSLFDNYEWAEGYSRRFGLFHVDFETQVRTPKASAEYFKRVIESRGATL